MPKIKKTYIQQKQECFQSILGKYMPLNGIRSKSELSKKMGMKEFRVARWASNITSVKYVDLIRVLDYLHVTVDDREELFDK